MGAHAKYSASGSERWLNCPASIALSEKAPPSVDSIYAMEGTEAHECLEFIMRNADKKSASVMRVLNGKYPDTMIHHGLTTFARIQQEAKGNPILCETRVDLSFVEPGMFGTVDAAIVELFGTLWVIDYKYGAGRQVEPEENTQMIYYALGIAHKYNFNFEKVRLAIAQPRIISKRGYFRTWDIEIPELVAWTDRFKKGVAECKDPFASLKVGRWCFFCPASSICPAVSDQQYDEAQADFDVITYDDIYDGVTKTIKQLNSRKG